MAALVSNTSMTPNDVLELSIPELEGILDGIAFNNSTENSGSSPDRLEDAEVLKFLISNGGKL